MKIARYIYVGFVVSLLFSAEAFCQAEGIQSFQKDENAWRRKVSSNISVLQTFEDSMGRAGISNIVDAEQVFCYEVATKPMDYTGYTLNNTAITGFCGIIGQQLKDTIIQQFFATEENVEFNSVERCVVRPRLMIRFIRGVDHTDVMLSSPCHSFTIFYGGKMKAYNFRPGADIIDTMITSFAQSRVDFNSPALLDQLLPIGVVQTKEHQQVIEKQKGPVRSWDDGTQESEPQRKQGGWNNLQL